MGQTLSEPVVDKVIAPNDLPRPRTVRCSRHSAGQQSPAHGSRGAQPPSSPAEY